MTGEPFYRLCAQVAQRRPWATVAAALALTALAAYASLFLTIDTSTKDIIAEDVAFRENARAYERIFPSEGNPIVAVIDAPSAASSRDAAARLAERLRNQSDTIRSVETPGSEPYFQANALMFLETEQLRTLRERLESSAPLLTSIVADPSLRGVSRFMARLNRAVGAGRELPPETGDIVGAMADATQARADGREQVMSWISALGVETGDRGTDGIVLAWPHLDDSSLEPAQAALGAIRSAFAGIAADGASLRLTGEPALREQELASSFSGALYASILSFVLVALTLVIGIRAWRVIFALLATLIIGSIWTSGLAAVTVRELNLISLAFMVLFFGLGVDFGTHLALRQMELVARGTGHMEATRQAVSGEGPAIVLSAVCASIGFLSFLPTDYRGLAELGIISSLGMLVAAIVTLIVLPAIMTLLPAGPVAQGTGAGRRFAQFVEKHARPTLAIAAIVTVAAGVLSMQARIDVNPLNLQDPGAEAVRTYRDLAARPELSPYALNIASPSLDAARALATRLEKVQGVAEVRTIDSLVPSGQAEKRAQLTPIARAFRRAPAARRAAPNATALRRAFNQLRETAARTAEAEEAPAITASAARFSAALIAFEERRGTGEASLRALDAALTDGLTGLTQGLRQAAAARQEITIEDVPQELRRNWLAADGKARIRVLPAAEIGTTADLAAFVRAVQSVAPDATGLPVINTEAAEVVQRAFLEAIGITAAAILLILIVLRRRISDVVLIMSPLAIAAIWTVAGSVLLELPFNFANVIVIPLLLGLGVASSIHVVIRAREIARSGSADSILETSTPRAVLLADANTAVAFVTLAISAHRGLSSMGILLGLAITLSLIATVIVLPAVLALLKRAGAAGLAR